MNGPLAQIVVLVTYGNDLLKNGRTSIDLYPKNSTFQFCDQVDFREFRRSFLLQKTNETVVAADPNKWFERLKIEGCKELRLYFEHSNGRSFAKDYKLAGLVGGGGTWFIEAIYDDRSDAWVGQWMVTDQDHPDRKIWSVKYGRVVTGQQTKNLQIDLSKTKEKLGQTLADIADFAFKHNLEGWGRQFEKAGLILQSNDPGKSYYHWDLIPVHNYSLIAKQVLFAAGTGWVFGGMGSWNDLGFRGDDNMIYEKLSEQLYSSINEAIIAAVNSY